MRVLIVAKTRMGGGACIGAITEKGDSVRLIPFNADPHDGANQEYNVGDIWEITGEPETPLIPPHNENFVVHKKHRLHTTKDPKDLVSAIELLMPPKIGDPRKLYAGLLKTTENGSLYVSPGDDVPPYSTTFWQTDQPLSLEREMRKLRYRYPTKNGGCTLTFVGFQRPLETIPAGTLLRVSLAHWWRSRDTPYVELRCYVQLSGWFLGVEEQEEQIPTPEEKQPPSQMETSSSEILKNIFGYEKFLPFQEEIIEHIRKGEDALVVLPTGGGKSLCYQLPACIFNGLTVVVSPLIALMQDQVTQLEQKGIRSAFLNHTVEETEYVATMQKVRQGKIKLLYVAPETLIQRPEIHVMLYDTDVACLAIDEAHCISQWGHDFRPNYRELDWIREQFLNAVCIALTATATPRVQEDIRQSLNIPAKNQFTASFNRENLFISVEPRLELLGQTLAFLKKHADESGIIYCQRRKHADWLYENLVAHGISALSYHAGLDPDTRKQNQDSFINGDTQVIVATIAFGMGIDKADVRFVLHAGLPKNPESYYQEIGRAGRDGKRAECLLLFSLDDEDTIKDFIDDGNPSQRERRIESLQKLIAWATSEKCRRKMLLDYFEEPYENKNCGMCDNCRKTKIEQVDLTEPAQKFLSSIVRVEKSGTGTTVGKEYSIGILRNENMSIPICLPTGALYIIDILCGEKQEKIIEHEHNKLPTWGIGKEYNKEQWCYLASQIFQHNLFELDVQDGTLCLTDKGRETNTRNVRSEARFWGVPVDSVTLDLEASVIVEANAYESTFQEQYDYDPVLYEKLRDKRRKVAKAEDIQASWVVPMDSLKEMATKLPQTVEAFSQIRGIGEVRTERYADDFLPIIRAYCEEHEANSVESETEPPNTYVLASEKPILDAQELFYQLHDKRRMVADREKLPVYHIFSNETLQEMVTHLPQSVKAFRKIDRIGTVKTEKYADDFLPIIQDYCKEHRVGSVEKTIKALNTSKLTSKDPNEYDPELFELLQDKCRILAKAEHRAVFTNRTLKEMATHLPRTRTAFRRIHGIGTVKTEKYADDFLPIIRTYCEEHGIN